MSMTLALVHEWISARAGSESVFERLTELFPRADLYALSREPAVTIDVADRRIHTTVLDQPLLRRRRHLTLPAMPLAWRLLGQAKYDAVITSHHAFAHTNRLADGGVHLAYVHSPARYVWSPDLDTRGAGSMRAIPRALLKGVDRGAAQRVTAYAANSTEVARRIERYWDRHATIIFPPARVEYFARRSTDGPPTRDYVLGVGRWIPYKNMHLVIEAADLANLPAKIVGSGPEEGRIRAAAERASVPVEIIRSPSDSQLRELYLNATALVFPTYEDFGIIPVEAQAAGTPVVALGAGGALDTVADGYSGILTDSLSPAALAEAISRAGRIDPLDCRRNADKFSLASFATSVVSWASHWGVTPDAEGLALPKD